MAIGVHLKRSLSTFDVIALGVNATVGSGIFLMPATLYALVGPSALLCVVGASMSAWLVGYCFAQMGQQFTGTGGPYLYTRETIGRFWGFEVGWLNWWSRVASWAALTNGVVIALSGISHFFYTPVARIVVMGSVLLVLTAVNITGAKQGASVSTVFSLAKLIPLFVFVCIGLFYVRPERFIPFAPFGTRQLGQATLLVFYAFIGFESLLVVAGEMSNPQKAVSVALVTVLVIVAVLYVGVLVVTVGTLSRVEGVDNPIVRSAEAFLGPWGAKGLSLVIAISILGVSSSMALVTPRCLFALAEHGDLPFARTLRYVHPRFSTPVWAIVVTSVLTCSLAFTGTFKDLAVISVLSRSAQYLATPIAVIVYKIRLASLRTRDTVIACAAFGSVFWFLAHATRPQLMGGFSAFALGIPFYLASKKSKHVEYDSCREVGMKEEAKTVA